MWPQLVDFGSPRIGLEVEQRSRAVTEARRVHREPRRFGFLHATEAPWIELKDLDRLIHICDNRAQRSQYTIPINDLLIRIRIVIHTGAVSGIYPYPVQVKHPPLQRVRDLKGMKLT